MSMRFSFPSRLTGSINSKNSSVSLTSANMEHGRRSSITFKMFLQSGLASEDKVLCVQCPHSQDFLFKAKYFETAHVPSVVISMSH